MFKYGSFRRISVMPIQNDNRERVNGCEIRRKDFRKLLQQ